MEKFYWKPKRALDFIRHRVSTPNAIIVFDTYTQCREAYHEMSAYLDFRSDFESVSETFGLNGVYIEEVRVEFVSHEQFEIIKDRRRRVTCGRALFPKFEDTRAGVDELIERVELSNKRFAEACDAMIAENKALRAKFDQFKKQIAQLSAEGL